MSTLEATGLKSLQLAIDEMGTSQASPESAKGLGFWVEVSGV